MKKITHEFGPKLIEHLNEGGLSQPALLLHKQVMMERQVSQEWLQQHLDLIGGIMMMETTFATAVDRIIGLENELEELRKKKAPKKNAMQGEKGS
jgi:hypothetical protein